MGEKWIVVGYRDVNFTGSDGKHVEGISLFLSREMLSQNGFGDECMKLFYSKKYVDYQPVVGDAVLITYNRYGKVAAITSC